MAQAPAVGLVGLPESGRHGGGGVRLGVGVLFGEAQPDGDPIDQDLAELVGASSAIGASTRSLTYDALRACAADGELHPGEIEAVRTMNARLGHPDALADQWLELHQEEQTTTAGLPTGGPARPEQSGSRPSRGAGRRPTRTWLPMPGHRHLRSLRARG
ncbi:hypothetical protein [Nonomuraea sp. NPDC049684]|uniref:hypothetical protein n=1 Tax=Nonomuraea sp. NPDC049684 TaxID=3364356 RepID=UPI00378E4461